MVIVCLICWRLIAAMFNRSMRKSINLCRCKQLTKTPGSKHSAPPSFFKAAVLLIIFMINSVLAANAIPQTKQLNVHCNTPSACCILHPFQILDHLQMSMRGSHKQCPMAIFILQAHSVHGSTHEGHDYHNQVAS